MNEAKQNKVSWIQKVVGRHEDDTIVICTDCAWEGELMNCNHSYSPTGIDDVEPTSFCPRCSSDQLEDLATIRDRELKAIRRKATGDSC